ncbi:MAG: NusG domain II-containing protein [Magnetococcales bacterium]|nr:NusG domain II-containing protein [Magnetococcales bacterium]
MKLWRLALRATNTTDRWVILISALAIAALMVAMMRMPGNRATVYRDNQPILTVAMDRDLTTEVTGRLGPVRIQVEGGRIRLLEYDSPRMIGTRTGWIRDAGGTTACVPCGILIRVEGEPEGTTREFDAVAH